MNARVPLVVIAEDEPKLSTLLADYLHAEHYATQVIADGDLVIETVKLHQPDLLLLDLMLPNRDGMDICRELRTFSQVPIMIVTARVEEIDRLLGLDLGADDYICKPFSPREVVARIKAVLRRAKRAPEHTDDVVIDAEEFNAKVGGVRLDLTPAEFKLLKTLSAAPGRVFSRQQLMNALYHDHRAVVDRTVDSHIKNLRRKLADAAPGVEWIESVYGVGYRFLGR